MFAADIEQFYTQVDKVDRLRNGVEPFAALFWPLGIVLANTGPCPPAWRHSTAVHKASPYLFLPLVQFSTKMRCPPCPISYLGMLFLSMSAGILSTNVIVTSEGQVTWLSSAVFRSSCAIDVEFFPFDEQICSMKVIYSNVIP